MMARVAALLILASQLLLLWCVLAPSGRTSIWFTLVGHPLVIVGVALGTWALTRRLMRESQERKAAAREGS